jgi:mannose-1-phosphate guanylyltransferase/phosphomannomutase
MRGLAERFGAEADAILTDGVKLNLEGDAWVLMLPDPDNPLFYVYAEGSVEANEPAKSATNSSDVGSYPCDSDRSEALVSDYARLVEEIIKSE